MLSDHIDGELDSGASRALEQHLKSCDACRKQAESLHVIADKLVACAPDPGPIPDFADDVMARLPDRQQRPVSRVRWAWGACALAAAAIVMWALPHVSMQRVSKPDLRTVVRKTTKSTPKPYVGVAPRPAPERVAEVRRQAPKQLPRLARREPEVVKSRRIRVPSKQTTHKSPKAVEPVESMAARPVRTLEYERDPETGEMFRTYANKSQGRIEIEMETVPTVTIAPNQRSESNAEDKTSHTLG